MYFCLISISNNSADDEERWECFGCRRYSWSNAGAGSAVGKEHIKQTSVCQTQLWLVYSHVHSFVLLDVPKDFKNIEEKLYMYLKNYSFHYFCHSVFCINCVKITLLMKL